MCRWLPVVLAALLFALAGCGGGGGGGTAQPDPTVRALNASPDSVSLEFLIDDNVHVGPLAYLASTPTFVALDPNIYDITLREAGTTMELWSQVFEFNANTHKLLIAVGLEFFGSEFEKRLRLHALNVNRQVVNGTKARVYFLHAYIRAAGFQTPEVDFQSPGQNPQFILEDIPFAGADVFEVDAGPATQWEARVANTINILATTTVTLEAGKIYIAVFSGIEGAAPPQEPKITFVELQTD